MRSIIYAAFAPVTAAALLGCGTIMHGTSEPVGIASLPRGASVTVNGKSVGTTPVVVIMSRRGNYTVRIACSGYEPYVTRVQRHASGATWLNLLFLPSVGAVGLVGDLVTGGMYNLSTEQVAARLVRDSTAAPGAPLHCGSARADPKPPGARPE